MRSEEFKSRAPFRIEDCTRTDESLDEGLPLHEEPHLEASGISTPTRRKES